ncbi:MAG: DUF1800 domain-containing protein [Pseudomonadota bacterium]
MLALLAVQGCFGTSDDSGAPIAPPPTGDGSSGDTFTKMEASRFLSQSTFGPSDEEIDALEEMGASEWFRTEFAKPQESILQTVLEKEAAGEDIGPNALGEAFWDRAILSDDQLRQRFGYALSQIFVASYRDAQLEDRPVAMANYMDIMSAGAFGNFRQTLENVTYSPAMAIYLTYLQNQKADAEREVVPDENYAREVMQLFTIGLLELNNDGSLRLDGSGQPIETYDNEDVTELAKVFTGLSWAERDRFLGNPNDIDSEYLPLVMYEEEHSPESKTFLGVTIPANTGGDQSIDIALDALFNHPNTPPFISEQLIQRLVTSNPSRAYVARVSEAFRTGNFTLPDGTNAGGGGRGDMRAVVAAILMDIEARDTAMISDDQFGKIREPILRFTHWARAFGVDETATDDIREIRDTSPPSVLGQQAYRSPSVFNFYRPGFVAPGSQSAAQGLVAPELQITTGSSITGYANFMEDFIFNDASDINFLADYSDELLLANDPAALVDHLDEIFTYGTLSTTTRTRIIEAVNSIQGTNNLPRDETRVAMAVQMVLTSQDYLVQR